MNKESKVAPTIMTSNNAECSTCYEKINDEKYSKCINCVESGIMCYNCELKWVEQNNNPKICSICKNESRINISEESQNKFESHLRIEITGESLEITQPHRNPSSSSYNNSMIKYIKLFIYFIFLYHVFSASYYLLFQSKKYVFKC